MQIRKRHCQSVYSATNLPMAAGSTPGQGPGKHKQRRQKQANDFAAVVEMQKAVKCSCFAAVRAIFKYCNALTVFFIVDVIEC